jgi:hypothetical protein
MLAVGLLSGIVMNFNRDGHIAWLSGSIIFTFALCIWSLAAVIIELTTYRAFGGKRTAYLTIANFLFLALVLGLVLLSPNQHAGETHTAKGKQPLTITTQGAPPRCIG